MQIQPWIASPGDRFTASVKHLIYSRVIRQLNITFPEPWLDVDVETACDYASHQLVVKLNTYLISNTKTIRRIEKVPLTWWDHIKLRFKFGTVAYKEIPTEIIFQHLCPHISGGGRKDHIEFLEMEEIKAE
jgi:hypothetical protein